MVVIGLVKPLQQWLSVRQCYGEKVVEI